MYMAQETEEEKKAKKKRKEEKEQEEGGHWQHAVKVEHIERLHEQPWTL